MKRYPWRTLIVPLIIGGAGVGLLWSVDWRIAVGGFLIIWGDNVARRPR